MLRKILVAHVFIFLCYGHLLAANEVNVGGYVFPPFIEEDEQGNVSGMTVDIIDSLNKIQSEYHFNLVLTSSRRRYISFQQGQFDLLFFESILWGWQKAPIEATKVFFKGGRGFYYIEK